MWFQPSSRGAAHETMADAPPGTAMMFVGASKGVVVLMEPITVRYGGVWPVASAKAFQLSVEVKLGGCPPPSSDMTPVNWIGARCWLVAQSLSCFHSVALAV